MVSAAVWQPKTVAVYWQQEEEKAERNLRFLTNLYTKDRNKPIIPNPGLNVRVFFCPKLFSVRFGSDFEKSPKEKFGDDTKG